MSSIDPTAPACALQLLGTPTLTRSGRVVTLKRRQARALLFFVGAHDGPVARDVLLGLIWPDKERAVAQQNLRTLLHGLRRELGPHLVDEANGLRLAADVVVDVRSFEAGLAGGADELAAALRLYRGDFLEGFALTGAPDFDSWALIERERLRRLAVRGFTQLSARHAVAEQFAEALAALDRALALDPLQEDVQREALRLHMLAGDRPGAIRRYDHLRRLLDEELGVTPMAETRALYDAIINDRWQAPRPATPIAEPSPAREPLADLPFVGRQRELQDLEAVVGRSTLVLIEGEPGIGKTRLALHFAAQHGLSPWIGAAYELESGVPYAPIIEALRTGLSQIAGGASRLTGLAPVWRQEAARLLPELAGPEFAFPGSAATEESRIREALYRVALALHQAAPGLLVLDDLHWADTATLAFVGYLIRRAGADGQAMTVVATTRSHGVSSGLGQLTRGLSRENRLVALRLDRLEPTEIDRFARGLSATYATPLGQWLVRNSEGNPYILTELIHDLRRSNTLRADGVVNLDALSTGPALPQSVSSLILSRLARLSDGARRVLDAAVAAGREFDAEVVWRAAGLSEVAGLDALDELRATGLIHSPVRPGTPDTAEVFHFDHTLTMEAAYRDIGETRHRMMHRRVAEALEQLGRDHDDELPALLAWHFREGGAFDRAAPYAFRAGQRAARLAAWAQAIEHYEHALAGNRSTTEQVAILSALAQAQLNSGQAALTVETYRRAITLEKDPERLASLRIELARAYFMRARYADAVTLAGELAADTTLSSTQRAQAELLWGTALSVEGSDLSAAAAHLQRAAALVGDCAGNDPAFLAQTLFERGGLAAQQGDLTAAVGFYRESLRVAEEDGDLPMWEALSHNNLAYHLHLLGDPAALQEAETHIQRGLRLAEDRGLLSVVPYLYSTRGELQLAAGDLASAAASFGLGLTQAEAVGMAERIAGLNANLGLVALRRGEVATAIHRLSTALAQADAIGTQHLAAQIRIWLAPLLSPAEAAARLAEARAIAQAGGRSKLLEQVERAEAGVRGSA